MGKETTVNDTTVILALIGIVGATFGGNGFWQWIMTKRKEKTPADRMILSLGKYRLNMLCKEYLKNGEIPEDEYESFIAMGEAYLAMGGNSKVKKLFYECKKLHLDIEERK